MPQACDEGWKTNLLFATKLCLLITGLYVMHAAGECQQTLQLPQHTPCLQSPCAALSPACVYPSTACSCLAAEATALPIMHRTGVCVQSTQADAFVED